MSLLLDLVRGFIAFVPLGSADGVRAFRHKSSSLPQCYDRRKELEARGVFRPQVSIRGPKDAENGTLSRAAALNRTLTLNKGNG